MHRRHAWVPLIAALLLATPAWAQPTWYRVSFSSAVNIPDTTPGLSAAVGCGQMSGVLGDFLATAGSTIAFPAPSPIEAATTQFTDCADGVTPTFPARSWSMIRVVGFGDFDVYLTPGGADEVELVATVGAADGLAARFFETTIPSPCGPNVPAGQWCVVAIGDSTSPGSETLDFVSVQYNYADSAASSRTFGLIDWTVAPSPDTDGDGVQDPVDACPGFDDTLDADGDGAPDDCDFCPFDPANDADDDGICGDVDVCPGFPDSADGDLDGIPDGCDACPADPANDADMDGVCGDVDVCAGYDDNLDSDGDGMADGCDACPLDPLNDADGDGVCGDVDICPGSDDNLDSDGDGIPNGCDTCAEDPDNDADMDGVCGDVDQCPGFDDTQDADGDGLPDGCDTCPLDPADDADGDGVCGNLDLCPGFPDSADGDLDGIPDGCDDCPFDSQNDADQDGWCEADDNCDLVPNSDQLDNDADGLGDACDPDDDDDGVVDTDDNCPYDPNADQADADGDGIGDACDESTTDDADGDGVTDDVDRCVDTAPGAAVDEEGCSIAQLCPCEDGWKNHGAYVSCTARTSEAFVHAGRISDDEKDAIVSAAAQSACGSTKGGAPPKN